MDQQRNKFGRNESLLVFSHLRCYVHSLLVSIGAIASSDSLKEEKDIFQDKSEVPRSVLLWTLSEEEEAAAEVLTGDVNQPF